MTTKILSNGKKILELITSTASAFLTITSATDNSVELEASGTDTNIDVVLTPKGSGAIRTPTNYSMNLSNSTALTTKTYVDDKAPLSVKEYGAVGDGSTDDTAAIQDALNAGAGGIVYLPKGVYRCTATITVPPGTIFQGEGFGAWRAAPFSNIDPGTYASDTGSVLLFTGTGTKDKTVDFLTSTTQCGFDRPNQVRDYNNSYDEHYLLSDFTNKDAVTTTRATLRQFSVGVILGTGDVAEPYPVILQNIRIVTSCPGIGETYGTMGYGNQTAIVAWSHWDVGVWAKMPWKSVIKDCQIVGYWDIMGVLATSMSMSGSTTLTGGFAEYFKITGGAIQSGLSIRSGDIWPILAKTSDTLDIEWTASHRFTTSGSIVTDVGTITYTGLTYTAGTPNKLTFTGCSSTASIEVSGDSRSMIRTTPNGGWANTVIHDVEINDFSHSTRVEEQAPAFSPNQMPFRAAIEISGHPTRGIALNGVLAFGTGPIGLHFGNARDIELYSSYFEPKKYKMTVGGADQLQGAAFIHGPKSTYVSTVPLYDRGIVLAHGIDFTSMINQMPLVKVNAASRLASVTDIFNPRGYYNQRRNQPADDLTTKLIGHNSKSLQIITQTASGTDRIILDCDSDGNLTIGPAFASNVVKITSAIQRLSNEGNRLQFEQTDAPTDTKVCEFANVNSAGTFVFRTLTDGYATTGGTTAWEVKRTGLSVTGQEWTINSGEFIFTGGSLRLGSSSGPLVITGTNTPEGAVSAPVGSLFLRTDGGAGTTLYVKQSGTGNTGWGAK